jgi:hypothetical protein
LEAHAVGVQIYECRATGTDGGRFEWAFKAPEADLFDRFGDRIGRHSKGPAWELTDGSRVIGEVIAKESAPDAGGIPWLLLGVDGSGSGRFGPIRRIQRLDTIGGEAPAGGCSRSHAGEKVRVAYRARYLFFRQAP